MDFGDRLGVFLIGCLVGAVLGYIVRFLQDIKKELHEVDLIVRKDRNEDGFIRMSITQIALMLLAVIIAWAAFASQKASNDSKDATTGLTKVTTTLANVTFCNQQFLAKLLTAVNERTEFSQEQAQANVNLQKAQLELLKVGFQKPPATQAEGQRALKKYLDSLTKFVTLSAKSANKVSTNPYPTNEELRVCLETEHDPKEKP